MLLNIGRDGYSWSSTFTGNYVYRLYLYFGGIYSNDNGARAHGFQLRCLQE
ncbi:MAG: hypothetical protein K2G93_06060 [Rikenella sp.]|nr:hypothetical protein [Rikenella sp.]